MNILETVLKYNNHWRPKEAAFSVSQLSGYSNYQLWLASIDTPETFETELDLAVPSKIGTGFHMIAEKALMDDFRIFTEESMEVIISEFNISGTLDIAYEDNGEWIIGDFKTKGTYQMSKALVDGVDDTKIQLSIYAYMWSKTKDQLMAKKGEVYLIHVGDKGRLSKANCEKMGLPEKSTLPKYKTVTVDLMTAEEVELYIEDKLWGIVEEPFFDCDTRWKCSYCNFLCTRRV